MSGPGKALRQENRSNQSQVSSLASSLRSTTLTSDSSQHQNASHHETASSKPNDSDASGKNKSEGGSVKSSSSNESSVHKNENGFGYTAKYSSQPAYLYTSRNEDLAKCEKFRQILENDPINIGNNSFFGSVHLCFFS